MVTPDEIKHARIGLGETQKEFAARFGVNQSTVQRWETLGLPSSGIARNTVEKFMAEIGMSSLASEGAMLAP